MSAEKPNYSGMTTNERLYVAGLISDFDTVAKSRDRAEMIRILQKVDISEPDAASIVDQILATPGRYGY